MEDNKQEYEKVSEEELREQDAEKIAKLARKILSEKVLPARYGKIPAKKKQEKKSRKINQQRARKGRKFAGKNHRAK